MRQPASRCALAAVLLLGSAAAWADPGYYVVTAYDNAGLTAIDLRYWTVRMPRQAAVLWPELGISYGVNSRWTTELLASTIGTWDTAIKSSSINWINDVLLTQGQYPFDLGIHTQIVRNQGDSQGGAFEFGPVFQTEFDRTQLNANLFFERTHGGWQDGTAMKYQWQVRQHWKPLLNFGAQGFGELGPWDRWSPRSGQSHRAGPAVFGAVYFGPRRTLRYQAAYLFGRVYGQQADMFTMRAVYEF